jgi:hypothetical protein
MSAKTAARSNAYFLAGAAERKRLARFKVTEKVELSDSYRLSFVPAFCTANQ